MKVHKDKEHIVSLQPFAWQGKQFLMVSVGYYVSFTQDDGVPYSKNSIRTGILGTEQDFWKKIPDIFAHLGQAPVLDYNLPKPSGEVLVAGFCRTPHAQTTIAQNIAFKVGSVERHLAIFGQRERLTGGGITEPIPFSVMPLIWENAFGGSQYAQNPVGKGLDATNKPHSVLPNIEDPRQLLLEEYDMVLPSCPFPIDIANPARRALSGTYDQHWVDTRWPAYPDDCDKAFFYAAQEAQRIPLQQTKDEKPFFKGDETIEMHGMHHDFPHIYGTLPSLRPRAFVKKVKEFMPFGAQVQNTGASRDEKRNLLPYAKDVDADGILYEVELQCDTVWLFPDLMGCFALYRGLLTVEDDEMDDILRVLVVSEKMQDTPKSIEYYAEELLKRAHPAVEIDLAPFKESQAQTTKAVKMARDVPKVLQKMKKSFLGQEPVMPIDVDDMARTSQKVIDKGRATLDILEKQVAEQKKQCSHLMNFNAFDFASMRNKLDTQEKNLHEMMAHTKKVLQEADQELDKSIQNTRQQLLFMQESMPIDTSSGKNLMADLDKVEKLKSENLLSTPADINPWHNAGMPIVVAAKRKLSHEDVLLESLQAIGFDEKTIQSSWLGYIASPLTLYAKDFGLPEDSVVSVPIGLCVPRFAGAALESCIVYPLLQAPMFADSDGSFIIATDPMHVVRAPGSTEKVLSLPASYDPLAHTGAVVVLPEDLAALFAEQELGDFCHIVAAHEPSLLAEVEDLPDLETAQDIQGEAHSVPLAIILPPIRSESKALFASWQKLYPMAIPVYLPEGCPHVFNLASHGYRLRRVVLDVLPKHVAQLYDFDIPLPDPMNPSQEYSFTLPLPTQEELSQRISTMIAEVQAHFSDPEQIIQEAWAKEKEKIIAAFKSSTALYPRDIDAAIKLINTPPKQDKNIPTTVRESYEIVKKQMLASRDQINKMDLSPDERGKALQSLEKGEENLHAVFEKLLPLDKVQEQGMKDIENLKNGIYPQEIQEAFALQGGDIHALHGLSRAEVESILAGDKDLSRRNLSNLDMSFLDFTGANLSHAICANANFTQCCMDKVDFTFAIADNALFTGARFHDALFKQTALTKAIFTEADLSASRFELVNMLECDFTKAKFSQADLHLCVFLKCLLAHSNFSQASFTLCTFMELDASHAIFDAIRGFKLIFQKVHLENASFNQAVLQESLMQTCTAAHVPFVEADLRKFYTGEGTDLSYADFTGAVLNDASLRLTYLVGAEFYKARLENTLLAHCDLSHARLDGLWAKGCRFRKCDLSHADISHTNLMQGDLYKCRLNATSLQGANLFAVNVNHIQIDDKTDFSGANLQKTRLAHKEDILEYVTRKRS